MKYKKSIIIILFFVSVILTPIYIIKTQNVVALRFVKNLIPQDVKESVKKGFFFLLREEYADLRDINERLENKVIQLTKEKDLVNFEIFPQTQFQKLKYKEMKLKTFKFHSSKLDNERRGLKVIPYYIENFKDKTILFSITGQVIYFETEDLINSETPKEFTIQTNLADDITLKDALIFDNKIFVSITYRRKSCDSIDLFVANFNLKKLEFEEFYSQNKKGECKGWLKAGRLAKYLDNGENSILLIAREPNGVNHFLTTEQQKLQESHGSFDGSIIVSFNLKTKKKKIISSGHRNPQGLFVTSNNIILQTEHGPRGGDEINKIIEGKNYGWPISSYGENYYKGLDAQENYRFKKSHSKYGLEEPIYAFVPSIGISQIIELPNSFSKKWQDNFLIASMKQGSLYRVNFNKDFTRVITWERMRVGKRIRDLSYDESTRTFFLALEDNTGSIGILRAENK